MNTTSKQKPFIIPVFIPHAGCPHQCVFCNQSIITGINKKPPTAGQLRNIIEGFLKYKTSTHSPVQISFYGGTFLGLDARYVQMALRVATEYVKKGAVDSLRFSTRPDSIDISRLNLLEPFPVKTIEIGIQSMDNGVLQLAGRGHTAEETEEAVVLLKKRGYEIGAQIMAGLPGDSEETILKTAKRLGGLEPDFARIYPAVVLRGSQLEKMYNAGIYEPLNLYSCVSIVKKLYLYFSQKKIRVIRMGLQATEDFERGTDIISGPYHPAFGQMVISAVFLDMARLVLEKYRMNAKKLKTVKLNVHKRDISKMRGLKNCNIKVLKAEFGIDMLRVVPDEAVFLNNLKCDNIMVDMKSLYH